MTALGLCANGDGNPICPPSKVICRACMDRIGATLAAMAADAAAAEAATPAPTTIPTGRDVARDMREWERNEGYLPADERFSW